MDSQRLIFNSRDEMLRIDVPRIVYFEADGNYTYIVTCNKLKSAVCMNLGQMEDMLAQRLNKEKRNLFARIGKKYIVNLDYIYKVNPLKKQLVLTDFMNFSYQLDISKEALKTLKEMMVKIKI
ncbi:MAG: LytTR family transcriptional regulator [Muribaculaceae bacterium]|jgi:DNA-binding LytR/AlgR family response regulator|nr:LytTR family transcriptional regulator [Muribaculaceae bacterium]